MRNSYLMSQFQPKLTNQKGATHLLLLFTAIAVIAFLGLSSLAPFKDQLFSTLNRKPDSFASETRTEYLVKPYIVYPADKPKYPEYETAVSNYMVELRNWYQAKVGKTFEMTPLQVVTAPEDYLTIRCGGTPSQECINDPARLEGNIGMVANKAIHNGIERWDEKTATLVFFAGAGGYAGANKYASDTGFAISGDWVLEPISGKANDWGIPCSYSQGWQCSGGVPGGTPAHELGHAFGLPHPGSQYASQTIMEWHGNYPTIGFIPQEIEFLQASPFFNPLPEASSSPLPSSSPQVSEVARDKFDRVDNSVLGSTDTGQSWEILKGSFGIQNNQAYPTNGCPAPGYAVIDTGLSDGVYQIKLATNQQDLRIPFRVIDLNNMYWIETKGGNVYNISKLVNGAGSSLGELSGVTAQNGDLLEIVLKGSRISVFVNGVLSSEITDSSVNGTKYGIGLWCNGAVRFDDLSFSKFEIPSPAPSATPAPSPIPSPSPMPTTSPVPTPTSKLVFVTSGTYNGNLGGVSGADLKCQSLATTAGLNGTYKAWISSKTQSASSRLTHSTLPYKLVNGTSVAVNWNDFADASHFTKINITELGTTVTGQVWTNSTRTGGIYGTAIGAHCNNWADETSARKGRAGSTAFTTARWTSDAGVNCNIDLRLYCLEQ